MPAHANIAQTLREVMILAAAWKPRLAMVCLMPPEKRVDKPIEKETSGLLMTDRFMAVNVSNGQKTTCRCRHVQV